MTTRPTFPAGVEGSVCSSYIASLDRPSNGDGAEPPAPIAKRYAKAAIPPAVRPFAVEALTNAIRPWARRRARRLARGSSVRIHLGSGDVLKQGWINVDLVGHRTELVWNLRQKLPFGAGTVDAIFHEHLLEHVAVQDGFRLLCDSHRVLKPGGVLRIGVPDAEEYARSYVAGGEGFIARVRPGRPTPLLALIEAFYSWGHKAMYDFATLELMLRSSGFSTVERSAFGCSRIEPSPDSPPRKDETLYVEAVK